MDLRIQFVLGEPHPIINIHKVMNRWRFLVINKILVRGVLRHSVDAEDHRVHNMAVAICSSCPKIHSESIF
jgi:hypothetical protein